MPGSFPFIITLASRPRRHRQRPTLRQRIQWTMTSRMVSAMKTQGRCCAQRHAHAFFFFSLRFEILMAHAAAGGSKDAAAGALAGLQICERSDLTIDTTTEPKEGGNGA